CCAAQYGPSPTPKLTGFNNIFMHCIKILYYSTFCYKEQNTYMSQNTYDNLAYAHTAARFTIRIPISTEMHGAARWINGFFIKRGLKAIEPAANF
ncbi:MAG: hypothetical protein CFH05_01715, partial [Alphaproteobacteria bacterium MarineAlpha3_Bin4]